MAGSRRVGMRAAIEGEAIAVTEADFSSLPFNERLDSLVGVIADQLGREIVAGALPPGTLLNSVDLAARFQTSRTPVREALMLLEREGLVVIPPRRRPQVASISHEDIREAYEIRAALNALMIELFIRNADATAMGTVRDRFERMKAAAIAGDMEGFFSERVTLHEVWASLCGNATLYRISARWRLRMSLRRLAVQTPEYAARSLLDHERLMLACEDRDGPLAAALIRSMTFSGINAIRASGWPGKDTAARSVRQANDGVVEVTPARRSMRRRPR